uniref:tRNA(Phe) (4-demethylwyosine(37)-C(7)) aminocarboxypropyltransferase n=1 Tax=Heterorhabditis bacteriophora TaxID=37862 RepID=A0A1I7X0Z8_HETBA
MLKQHPRISPLERKSSINEDSGNPYDSGGQRSSSIEQLTKASPFGQMLENVRKLASSKSLWDIEMQKDLPKKWEKHGDMVVFPQNSFTHNNWRYIDSMYKEYTYLGRELWKIVAESLKVSRLGRKRLIADEYHRTPHVDILYGEHGWVEHVDERGIRYIYDASKRVFNNTKKKEMQRISEWDCHGETVIDMYAGLGYYTFPFLLSCHAKQVYAIDWDDDMCDSLRKTAEANNVTDRLTIIEGDSRRVTPPTVADRVFLGLVPSCRAHWLTACKALKPDGGMIHIHETLDVGRNKLIKKEPAIKKHPEKLPSVDEEGSAKENHPECTKKEKSTNGTELENTEKDTEKLVQNVLKEFEKSEWQKLDAAYKEFAMDCATTCTRFLNNIHLSDTMYCVTIVNLTKFGTSSAKSDHIVLDLLCTMENANIEALAAKFTNTNFS